MNAPKHTPGPWTVHPCDDPDLFTQDMRFISGPGADVHGFMSMADASLIAAAPDLLAALVDWVTGFADDIEGGEADPVVAASLAAIAKATGKTS